MPRISPKVQGWLVTAFGACAAVIVGYRVGSDVWALLVAAVLAVTLFVALLASPGAVMFLGGTLAFIGIYSFIGIPLPEIGGLLIITAAVFGARVSWRLPGLLLITSALLLVWLTATALTELSDPLVIKRLQSLLLWTLVVAAVALPGAQLKRLAQGLLLGLVLSVPAGALLGSGYGTRWAGLIGDPNAYALTVAVCTPLIVDKLSLRTWQKAAVWGVAASQVILADSRTGMASLATAGVVYALLPVIRGWAIGLPVLTMYAASQAPSDLVRGGRWEERAGSDELRRRIDDANDRQIAESPWTGHGLGEGKVNLSVYGDPPEDLSFFLHNSYKSLITEVGLIGVGLYATLAIGAVLHALSGQLARGGLTGMAAAAVMASQLGEVLFAIPAALAIGFAWATSDVSDASETQSGVSTDSKAITMPPLRSTTS